MRAIFVDAQIPRLRAVKALVPILPGIIWSPISSARVADLPEPPLPGPRWLRVRNRQCGICGTDLSLLFVKGSPGIAPAALPANSRLFLGHEGVGGGWSQGYTAHETEIYTVPDDLNDDQALFIEPMAIALHAVLRRRPRSSEHVLVIGAGAIGLLTAQAVKAVEPGCHGTILTRYSHPREVARSLGMGRVGPGGAAR